MGSRFSRVRHVAPLSEQQLEAFSREELARDVALLSKMKSNVAPLIRTSTVVAKNQESPMTKAMKDHNIRNRATPLNNTMSPSKLVEALFECHDKLNATRAANLPVNASKIITPMIDRGIEAKKAALLVHLYRPIPRKDK